MAEIIAKVSIDDILAEFRAKDANDQATLQRVRQEGAQSDAAMPTKAISMVDINEVYDSLALENSAQQGKTDLLLPGIRILPFAGENFYEVKDPTQILQQRIGRETWGSATFHLSQKNVKPDHIKEQLYPDAFVFISQLPDSGLEMDLYDGDHPEKPVFSGALCPPEEIGARADGYMVFTPLENIVSGLHPSDIRTNYVGEMEVKSDRQIIENLSLANDVIRLGELTN